MKFSFKHFQFDCELQILTQDGIVLTLNEKPAQLLTLFLRNSDKIHSKADIFASVWPDRVVTDQVVFQNISYLRSLFGSDAIKTFTKKGYQWQLSLEVVEDEEKYQPQELENSAPIQKKFNQVNLHKTSAQRKVFFKRGLSVPKVIFPFVVFIMLFVGWFWLAPNINDPTISEQPKSQVMAVNNIYSVNIENLQMKKKPLTVEVTNQTLFDSPFSTWQTYMTDKNTLLVATKLYSVQNKTALRFHIQGENHGWHDYIFAQNKKEAITTFNRLLSLLASSNYFSISSNHKVLAKLTLLLNEQPENELLNQQLIKQTFKLNDLDRATALIDQQLAKAPEKLREALLNLLKTDITMRNKQWLTAKQSVDQALTIFKALKLPQLEARALIVSSWGYLFDTNFRLGMQVLNQAASKARESAEPLLEVNAHIIQSFIASKAGQMELAHTQQNLAKEIIALHQLSDEHQVSIENNLGWITESPSEAFQHYKNILAMPFSPQYEDHFYGAANKVRATYIKQQDWHKALTSIKPWQRLSFQVLNRAYIAYAQANWQQGLIHAKEAFQKAQVEHHKIDALNAALLILQNQKVGNQQVDTKQYDTFIKQNATRIWLDQNGTALEKLTKMIKG